jgi:hypothetical protein
VFARAAFEELIAELDAKHGTNKQEAQDGIANQRAAKK